MAIMDMMMPPKKVINKSYTEGKERNTRAIMHMYGTP
jgi:hypothetical protein